MYNSTIWKTKLLYYLFFLATQLSAFITQLTTPRIATVCTCDFPARNTPLWLTPCPAPLSLCSHATSPKRPEKQPAENIILFSPSYYILTQLIFLHKAYNCNEHLYTWIFPYGLPPTKNACSRRQVCFLVCIWHIQAPRTGPGLSSFSTTSCRMTKSAKANIEFTIWDFVDKVPYIQHHL